MSEESESKQDSQAVEFLKLFQQVGRSFIGLLLLEIGWTLFLSLATKLTGEEHGLPAIGGLPLSDLWLYGALVIVVIWGVYSRLISYVMAPVLIVLKIIFDILFVIVAIVFSLVDLLLLPIVRPTRKALIRRQLRADKAGWIAKNLKADSKSAPPLDAEEIYGEWLTKTKQEIGAGMRVDKYEWIAKYNKEHSKNGDSTLDPETAFNAWEVKAQREYAERKLESVAGDKVSLKENNLGRVVQLIGQNFLTPLHSSIVVGVAPLVRDSQGQELVFERAPVQQFGAAMAETRVRLSHLKGLKYIALHPLPSLFRIETDGRARFARWFFQLDTLLWGRYAHNDEQLAQIHFVTSGSMKVEDDIVGLPHHWKMFPRAIDCDFFANASAFTFSPNDPVEAHIVMSIAVLQALVRRHETGLPRFLVLWDKSYFSSSSDAKRVLVHLAFDIFPLVPGAAAPAQVLPTAVTALADILSRWAGYQLETLIHMDDEDRWITDQRELFAPQLHGIVSKCAKLMPNSAEHFYRLGALSCVIGKPERALDEFRHAAILDRNCERVRPRAAEVLADLALRDADRDRAGRDKDLALARFAAHAARAIYSGGGRGVREAMQRSGIVELGTIHPSKIHLTIALVQKLLAEIDTSRPGTLPQIPVASDPMC